MATLIRANHADLLSLAKVMGLNPDPTLTKKEMVSLLQRVVTEQESAPLEEPILPIAGGSGDAPPPHDNSDDKGDGEGSDDGELGDDPENDPMEPTDDEDFIIHIDVAPNRRIQVHVHSTDTIAIVKTHLQHLIGVHRRHQRLHFLGGLRDLEDDRTLNFYDIEEGDVLEMTFRIQGGRGFGGECCDCPTASSRSTLVYYISLGLVVHTVHNGKSIRSIMESPYGP